VKDDVNHLHLHINWCHWLLCQCASPIGQKPYLSTVQFNFEDYQGIAVFEQTLLIGFDHSKVERERINLKRRNLIRMALRRFVNLQLCPLVLLSTHGILLYTLAFNNFFLTTMPFEVWLLAKRNIWWYSLCHLMVLKHVLKEKSIKIRGFIRETLD